MQSSLNQNEKKQEIINELIKSPKQVKTIVKNSTVSDCVIIVPYTCAKSNVEEIIFYHVSFCDTFNLHSLPSNKMIILEDCIFHGVVHIEGIRNVKIIIKNCRFLAKLQINDQESGMIEFLDSDNGDDAHHINMLFHTDDVHRTIGLC